MGFRFLAALVAAAALAGCATDPPGGSDPADGPRRPADVAVVAAPPPAVRAMWVWRRADPAAIVTWAVEHGVNSVFVYVRPAVGSDLPRLRILRHLCDAAGIGLDALGGEPEWTYDHRAALAWRRGVAATGLFRGVHLDVEPYALPAWNTDRAATVRAFLALLTKLRGGGTPLELDVPFWYDTIPAGGRTLADEVVARADALTVMSYRDTATGPNSIMDLGADMLRRGGDAGRRVRLAVETQRLADCPHCTFHGRGAAAMAGTLAAVDAAARPYPAFAGVAVHGYDSWAALAP